MSSAQVACTSGEGFILRISSDWANVINAIIFEVLLIACIFFLTADVCARLNYLALVDGSVRELFVISPPILGGGVISTSRRRTLFMIMLRALGVFLIFGTALTIDGTTADVAETEVKTVLIPANFNNTPTMYKKLIENANLRSTCMVNINDTMVFGRLDTDGYCETDGRLLRDPIKISQAIAPTSVSFSSGCRHRKVIRFKNSDSTLEHVITTCELDGRKAFVFCNRLTTSDGVITFSGCEGSFQLSSTKFAACEYFERVLEGPSISINANCHAASNLGAVQDLWPEAQLITKGSGIVNMLGAVSLLGKERRLVTKCVPRIVTIVHPTWFLCLGLKLVLLVLLGGLSIQLRLKGTKRVLNDDRALLGLLRQKLDDWIGVSSISEQPTLYLHLQTNNHGGRQVWASTMPNYNSVTSNVEGER